MGTGGRRTATTVLLTVLAIWAVLFTGVGQTSDDKRPELHPTTLLLQPASPVGQGTTVKISVKLENTGPISADAFRVEFFLRPRSDDDAASAQSWTSFDVLERSGLSPEAQEVELSASLDTSDPDLIPSPGVYDVRVLVDSNDQIPELDEGNNELRTSLIVSASSQGQPDLRPRSLVFEPPSPVGLTDTVAMAATVANMGDRDASPFEVSFAYCRLAEGGNECAGQYREFDRRTFSGGLPKGASQSIDAQLDIPSLGLTSGRYSIRVAVDPTSVERPTGQIDEQDEANNTLTTGLFVQGPELAPTGLTFSPSTPHIGETIKVSAAVKNVGTGSATKIPVAFQIDGIQFALPTVTLADNESTEVTAFLRTGELNLSPGSHSVRVVIDPNDQIAERDETNNEIRTSLRLLPSVPQRPELRPKRVVFSPSSPVDLGQASSVAVLGEVLNTGEVAARGVRISFAYRPAGSVRWLDVPCSTNCTVDELSPGARVEAKAELDLSNLRPGRYDVRVVVDPATEDQPDGRIAELDEFNNEMQTSVRLLAARLPDLRLDGTSARFEPSLEIRHGDSVQIAIDVVNAGESLAQAFRVAFAASRLEIEGETVFAEREVRGLAPGERRTLTVSLNTGNLANGPGFYEVVVNVDPTDAIDELDETNNLFSTGTNPQNAQPLFVRGPDLSTGGLVFDESVASFDPRVSQGERVGLTLEVSNVGVEASDGFGVSYCVQPVNQQGSCEAFRAPDDRREAEQLEFPGLGVGTTVQSTTVLETAALDPGTYQILARVDANDTVNEENERNNTASQQLTVMPRPDLRVPRVSLDPSSPIDPGATLTVFADISNMGAGPARTPFTVGIGLRSVGQSGCPVETTREIGRLDPQQQVTVSARFDAERLSAGGFEVCVTADTDAVIPESNEANNVAVSRLVVGQFDLAVANVSFDPQPPIRDDQRQMTVFADLSNVGEGPVLDAFEVDFALRRVAPRPEEAFESVARVDVDGLDAGERVTAQAKLDTGAIACGTYELALTIDPDDALAERQRGNNRSVTRFTICPSDLFIRQVTFEPQPPLEVGARELKLFADVRNRGEGPVINPFDVTFELRRTSPEPSEDFRRIAETSISGIETGSQAAAKIEIDTGSLIAGAYELRVTADSGNVIQEMAEGNNTRVARFAIGIPDLVVQGVTFEPQPPVDVGTRELQFFADVRNTGEGPVIDPFDVTFELRRLSPTPSEGFRQVAATELSGVRAGSQAAAKVEIPTGSLIAGAYELRVTADSGNVVPEGNEGNNTNVTRFTIGIPDLVVRGVTFEPQPPLEVGTPELQVFADVRNTSDGPVIEPFNVAFELRRRSPQPTDSFRQVAEAELSRVAAGAQRAANVEIATGSLLAGIYELRIAADSGNAIRERNEGNNVRTVEFAIGVPDLAIGGVEFDPQLPISLDPESPTTLRAAIRNRGDRPVTEPFDVRVELGRVPSEDGQSDDESSATAFTEIGRATIDELGINAETVVNIPLDVDDREPGTYKLRLTADADGVIRERNEENNRRTVTVELGPSRPQIPDLTVMEFAVSSDNVMAGREVKVTAEIANVGREDAGSFRAVFFWKREHDARRVNFANFHVNGLEAGERRTLTARLDTSVLWRGTFELIAVVDNTNQVDEADEQNNEARTQLIVRPDP